MNIVKKPDFENDDYLFRLDLKKIPTWNKAVDFFHSFDPKLVDYYLTKRLAFSSQDTNPKVFSKFVEDKPSLRSLSELISLDSTIYTVACERENYTNYRDILSNVKMHLDFKPSTRRCVVRFINAFNKYFTSEITDPSDVTCLSFIHYLTTGPKLIFRASDIKNELLVDILTIKEFFLDPIYESSMLQDLQLSVYSSTAQHVSDWDNFVEALQLTCNAGGKS